MLRQSYSYASHVMDSNAVSELAIALVTNLRSVDDIVELASIDRDLQVDLLVTCSRNSRANDSLRCNKSV